MKFSLLLFFIFLAPLSYAAKIQLIHTNDLHSYFEGTRYHQGGYSRIKTVIDRLKKEGEEKGIQTLVLDAGDFGEGTSFYVSDHGADSLRALDELGIDATVIGNHDYLLGGDVLRDSLERAKIKTKILSANLEGKDKLQVETLVQNTADFMIGGQKIRVMGLSTSAPHYTYAIKPKGSFSNPVTTGVSLSNSFRKEKLDLVIALTHIGIKEDKKLAARSNYIDLIVGGHDHLRFDEPKLVKNKKGRVVPIVQTGANGLAVGSMIYDTAKKKVISYKLVDINPIIKEDKSVSRFVQNAKLKRNAFFDYKFDEVIGESKIPLTGYRDGDVRELGSCWAKIMATVTKEAVQADVGLHIDSFLGEEIPPGKIRFGDVVDNFPHMRTFSDQGWRISTTRINGSLLKLILNVIKFIPAAKEVTIAGLEYRALSTFEDARFYTLSFPDEVIFAIENHSEWLRDLLMPHLERSSKFFWPELVKYIKEHSPLECI